MASLLDANLYTLLIRPSPTAPKNLTQLIEPSRGTEVRYLRYRGRPDTSVSTTADAPNANGEDDPTIAFGGYDASLVDAYTGVRLASCSSAQPSHKAKSRRLELHNPDMTIPFEFSGSLGFEWQLTYEDRQLKWTRPTFGSDYVCSIDRKPDPSVQICIAKPPYKAKDGVIQLLDYNLARFDFQDLKGLELALYMSLLSIMDAAEDKVSYRKENSPSGPSRAASTKPITNGIPPPMSNQPVETTDPEMLNLEAMNFNADPNEMYIPASGSPDRYISRCVDMLGDDSMLFVILRSASPQAVQKVIEVADGAKRTRHRRGLDQEGRGLYQYVIENEKSAEQSTGRRVIKLDDSPSSKQETKYATPQKITIYLSKIELPDLQPKARSSNALSPSNANGKQSVTSSRPPVPSVSHRPPAHLSSSTSPSQTARLPSRGASPSFGTAPPSGRAQYQLGPGDAESTNVTSNEKSASRIGRLFRSKS